MSEFYPTWYAGEDITADKLNSGFPVYARKTADESVTSSTAVQNDDELFFSVAANAVYAVTGWIKYSGPGDLQIDWTTPTDALGEWVGFGNGTTVYTGTGGNAVTTDTSSSAGYMIRTETNDVAQSRTFGGISTNTYAVAIYGTLRTGATAGTYQFQWAQGTSNATATTVYTDSWLCLQRTA